MIEPKLEWETDKDLQEEMGKIKSHKIGLTRSPWRRMKAVGDPGRVASTGDSRYKHRERRPSEFGALKRSNCYFNFIYSVLLLQFYLRPSELSDLHIRSKE